MPEESDGMVVLGGGVAGLAAAMVSGAPLYEAEEAVGGVSRSKIVDGFAFDYGIHILQTQHATVHAMFQQCGIELGKHQRNAHIYSHDSYTAYPFQVNTAGLPIRLRARCVWNYLRRRRDAAVADYEQWILREVGRGFGETFLIPYSEKFWTVHPREMTYEWTGNRVPQANTRQVLRGAIISKQTKIGSNAVFEYPEHGEGYGAIPTRMSGQVAQVHLGRRATRIDTVRRCIEFNGGEAEVGYEKLIATIPLPELVRLIVDAPDEVRAAAARLRHNSIFVVNLGIDRPTISDKHWVHFPEKDVSFFRISYPHNLGPGLVPAGMSAVTAEVAYSDCRPIDRTTLVDRVIDDLVRTRALPKDAPIILRDTMDIKYAYVIYDHHRKDAVQRIHQWLKSRDIHPTGRYGLWAYLWSHEAILSGRQTAEKLLRYAGVDANEPAESH